MISHLQWRGGIKQRVRDVFQSLIESSQSVTFESKDECRFMDSLVSNVFGYRGREWVGIPTHVRHEKILILARWGIGLITTSIIDELVIQVDKFFDHLWKHVIVVDSTTLLFNHPDMGESNFCYFKYCLHAFYDANMDYSMPTVNGLKEYYKLDLSRVPDVNVRRKLCPLLSPPPPLK